MVAFGFTRASDAMLAELELRQLLDLAESDVRVRFVPDVESRSERYAATIAWRVRDGAMRTMLAVVGRHGGEPVGH
jgi:hypothetical protein